MILRAVSHCLAFMAAAGVVAFSIAARSDWKSNDQQRQKAAALKELTLVRWSLPKDARASAVTFTVNNQNPFEVKSLVVTCTQVTKAGAVISETTTIQQEIKANSSRTIAVPSSSLRLSPGALLSCNIDDIEMQARQRLAAAPQKGIPAR